MDIENEESSHERNGTAPLLSNPTRRSNQRVVEICGVFIRISAAVAAFSATITMGTTQQTLQVFNQFFQFQASFDDFAAFTFFVIAMSLVSGYLVLSIPFSVFFVTQPLAMGPRTLLIIFDILTVTFASSAASSSTAVVYLIHNGNSNANWLPVCQRYGYFCRKATGAVAVAFMAVILTVILVAQSSLALTKKITRDL